MANRSYCQPYIGPVVDVKFDYEIIFLAIYNALTVDYEVGGERKSLTLEVAVQLGDDIVRCTVAMDATDGLVRGLEVVDTGSAISCSSRRGNFRTYF